ncbi:MAG: tetratricopeptide repeat protein [Acidobacteriota bacterium]|nr:tetratricopeptide repeat protein [Acidobacteriota bacterium]MDH3786619.1 tetratricopeptide repeat protein [Acidobacteriota bacterium]
MPDRAKVFLAGVLLATVLLVAYSNHFNNGFRFDDTHTIVSNGYIADIRNIPSFFTDATTSSSLPANRAYRPVSTMLNAIDYRLGNGLDPFYFHLSMFSCYVVQLLLMFVMFRTIFDHCRPHRHNPWLALFGTGFYGLHAANAETLNYIGARTDSFSTLCIVASLVLYQNRWARRFHLYLLTMVVGILTKQTGVMFAPLLFLYILFFEEGTLEDSGHRVGAWARIGRALRKSAPAFVLALALFAFNQAYMTPETTVSSNQTVSRVDYAATQLYVMTHYLGNFAVPVRLSADPDFTVIEGFLDRRILLGFGAVLIVLWVAVSAMVRVKTRPIAYGILWFFVALAPTSSVVPLYQIANDHRTFFPYVGLAMAVSWGAGLVLGRYESTILSTRWLKPAIVALFCVVIAGHAYGTHRRNDVWSSPEKLWLDVTLKSPRNGRGLMNYGLTQMRLGRYELALDHYQRALAFVPHYSYLHINLGVVKSAMGKQEEAEQHFRNGLSHGRTNPEAYYFYARWLKEQRRFVEAKRHLEAGLALSPRHVKIQAMLSQVAARATQAAESDIESLARKAGEEPSAQNYANLSLSYYQAGRYEESIEACRQALELNPRSVIAYNNMCSALVQLGEYDRAIESCETALEIDPDFGRAKANLAWAQQSKAAR